MLKKTICLLTEQTIDYVVCIKRNQPRLFKCFQELKGEPLAVAYSKEKQKGRIEEREALIYRCPIEVEKEWLGAKTMIVVNRKRIVKGKEQEKEQQYYLSSLESDDAEMFLKGIRGHWHIENKLHWVKDVHMDEDKSGIKSIQACLNLSLLRTCALNWSRLLGYSWKESVSYFCNRINRIVEETGRLIDLRAGFENKLSLNTMN